MIGVPATFSEWARAMVSLGVVGSLALLAGCSGCTSNEDSKANLEPPALWKPVKVVVERFVPTPQAVATQLIQFDIAALRPPTNKRLVLKLPGGVTMIVINVKFEEIDASRFVWRGTVEGEAGGDVRFVVVNETMVGDIVTARGKLYAIRTIKPGLAVVEELDAALFPHEEGPDRPELRDLPKSPAEQPADTGTPGNSEQAKRKAFMPHILAEVPGRSNIAADARLAPVVPSPQGPEYIQRANAPQAIEEDTVIDVMILYTTGAGTYLNVPDGVEAKIIEIVSDANNSYTESGVHQRINVVRWEETDYLETGDIYFDWKALKRNGNGSTDAPQSGDLKSKKISVGADIVALLTSPVSKSNANSCGQAGQMHDVLPEHCSEAYAVIPSNCAATQYSFIHELGHVMGADHNENNDDPTNSPPYDYSRGFIAPSNSWLTVMSLPKDGCMLPECQRIRRWSNPAFTFAETPNGAQVPQLVEYTGSASANNAQTLMDTRGTVAAFSETCK